MPLLGVVFSLLGLALGTPASSLRATLGDPLLVETGSTISRTADYLRADDPAAVLRITERDGVIFAVEIERERAEPTLGLADDRGVRVGANRAAVLEQRGKPAFETVDTILYPEDPAQDASLIYRFDGDTLESIKLVGSGSSAAGSAALPQLADPAGDGYDSAILDLTPTVLGSDHFRDRYLTVHGCESNGRTSTIERRAGKTYAILSASCSGKQRTFYFDTTRARP